MTPASNQRVKLLRLDHGCDLALPQYQSELASGVDLYAAVEADDVLHIPAGGRAIVPTGLALEMPAHLEAQVRPRSGLAAKFGVSVLNTPGTIDADYRGELKVILINLGAEIFTVERGMRIAQLVFQPVTRVTFEEVGALSTSPRGQKGFGSSGGFDKKPD